MIAEEWKSQAAKRFIEKACVPEYLAKEMAETTFEVCQDDGLTGDLDQISPNDAVDEELTYWTD